MIFDISLPVRSGMAVWPGDPEVRIDPALSIAAGDEAEVSALRGGTHMGTHVDAPRHFLAGGPGVDRLPLDALMGPCTVVEADPAGTELLPAHLPARTRPRVLFKTRNSGFHAGGRFRRDFVGLGPALAAELVARGVRAVGIDYLSIEPFDAPGHPVHHLLLGRGVVIIESLDLSEVPAGDYDLVCLPLRLEGRDAAPARAILVRP